MDGKSKSKSLPQCCLYLSLDIVASALLGTLELTRGAYVPPVGSTMQHRSRVTGQTKLHILVLQFGGLA